MDDPVPPVCAAVLAGAKPRAGQPPELWNRALMRLDGDTLLAHVCRALRASSTVQDVVVVGDVPRQEGCRGVPGAGGFVENLLAGVGACEGNRVLVCTSDVPFLTPEAVDDFVRRAGKVDADLVYPVVPVDLCTARYPGLRRTALGLREGRFTGGNMVLVRPGFLAAQRDRIAESYAARKNVLRLGRMLGLWTLVRVALAAIGVRRAVGLRELEDAVGRVIGGRAAAVVSDYPEVATDIDRAEDLAALQNAAG